MSRLQLHVRVSKSPEQAAMVIERAARAYEAGDLQDADGGYRKAQAEPLVHAGSWSNLAALGLLLGDAEGALKHVRRAMALDSGNADIWVNFGVASWRMGQYRDAAHAMHQALVFNPGLEAAAVNYARMLRSKDRFDNARMVLMKAAQHNRGSWQIQEALAETCRMLGPPEAEATRKHALATLTLLLGKGFHGRAAPAPSGSPASGAGDAEASARVAEALFATREALDSIGVPFHLIGGTLLAIHRDGRPFPHDKDIDLGLPYDCDRNAVMAAMLRSGFRPFADQARAVVAESREWTMGFAHEASEVGVDLMFMRERDGRARFELGWPDYLACEMPAYPLQPLQWEGRDWLAPAPPRQYLEAIYGPDWDGGVIIRGFERRWFDTQISNPSRTAESMPRAVTLGLMRLSHALQAANWRKARALCLQLLAREALTEVRAILAVLDQAGHGPR